jgi:hypothetical protein
MVGLPMAISLYHNQYFVKPTHIVLLICLNMYVLTMYSYASLQISDLPSLETAVERN